MHIRFEEHWFNRFWSSFRKTSQQWESGAVCHCVLQCVAMKKLLKKSQENDFATWRLCFQGSLFGNYRARWYELWNLVVTFCANESSILLWVPCLENISLLFPRHSYLLSNLSGREQFYICRVCKRNQQPFCFVFRQGQRHLFNLLICISSWYQQIICTWPTHSREMVTEALLQGNLGQTVFS